MRPTPRLGLELELAKHRRHTLLDAELELTKQRRQTRRLGLVLEESKVEVRRTHGPRGTRLLLHRTRGNRRQMPLATEAREAAGRRTLGPLETRFLRQRTRQTRQPRESGRDSRRDNLVTRRRASGRRRTSVGRIGAGSSVGRTRTGTGHVTERTVDASAGQPPTVPAVPPSRESSSFRIIDWQGPLRERDGRRANNRHSRTGSRRWRWPLLERDDRNDNRHSRRGSRPLCTQEA